MKRVFYLGSLVWLAVMLLACSRPPGEDLLRADIDSVRQALENRKASDVMPYVSDDLLVQGKHRKRDVKRLMLLYFKRHKAISIMISRMDIEMSSDGEVAEVMAVAFVTGGKGLLPDSGNAYRVDSEWRYEGDHWRLARVNWRRAGTLDR